MQSLSLTHELQDVCWSLRDPSTSSPDIFRAVHRPQLEQGYTVALPLSTYTVYGYDIEEDELPNSMPAVVLDRLTLTHSTSKTCVL